MNLLKETFRNLYSTSKSLRDDCWTSFKYLFLQVFACLFGIWFVDADFYIFSWLLLYLHRKNKVNLVSSILYLICFLQQWLYEIIVLLFTGKWNKFKAQCYTCHFQKLNELFLIFPGFKIFLCNTFARLCSVKGTLKSSCPTIHSLWIPCFTG
jgi:hypothetical protein